MDIFKCAELTIGTFGLFYDINIEFMSITVCRKLGIYKLFLFAYKLKHINIY